MNEIISNELAQEYFEKLNKIACKKSYHAKRNWSDEEILLLNWSIITYCKKINESNPFKLDSNDWIEIARFMPGRNDS